MTSLRLPRGIPCILIILVRRRSRQIETSRLLMLLKNAGEQGLANNINIA